MNSQLNCDDEDLVKFLENLQTQFYEEFIRELESKISSILNSKNDSLTSHPSSILSVLNKIFSILTLKTQNISQSRIEINTKINDINGTFQCAIQTLHESIKALKENFAAPPSEPSTRVFLQTCHNKFLTDLLLPSLNPA